MPPTLLQRFMTIERRRYSHDQHVVTVNNRRSAIKSMLPCNINIRKSHDIPSGASKHCTRVRQTLKVYSNAIQTLN